MARRAIFQFNSRDIARLRDAAHKQSGRHITEQEVLQALNDALNEVVIPRLSRGLAQPANSFGTYFFNRVGAVNSPHQHNHKVDLHQVFDRFHNWYTQLVETLPEDQKREAEKIRKVVKFTDWSKEKPRNIEKQVKDYVRALERAHLDPMVKQQIARVEGQVLLQDLQHAVHLDIEVRRELQREIESMRKKKWQ